jgi:hypothetical protein
MKHFSKLRVCGQNEDNFNVKAGGTNFTTEL